MDSLTMLEIVMLVEQTLKLAPDNEELRDLRTIGDVKHTLMQKQWEKHLPRDQRLIGEIAPDASRAVFVS